jgi:hypothetical protein
MLRGGRRRLEGESVLVWGLFEEKRVRKSEGLPVIPDCMVAIEGLGEDG